jgi:hypothetical protein
VALICAFDDYPLQVVGGYEAVSVGTISVHHCKGWNVEEGTVFPIMGKGEMMTIG